MTTEDAAPPPCSVRPTQVAGLCAELSLALGVSQGKSQVSGQRPLFRAAHFLPPPRGQPGPVKARQVAECSSRAKGVGCRGCPQALSSLLKRMGQEGPSSQSSQPPTISEGRLDSEQPQASSSPGCPCSFPPPVRMRSAVALTSREVHPAPHSPPTSPAQASQV